MIAGLAFAAGLVFYNNTINRWKPFHGWAYVPANAAITAVAMALTLSTLSLRGAGLAASWPPLWAWAALASTALALVIANRFDRTRALLKDERVRGLSGGRAIYLLAVRIPFGTALTEEVLFRGVLLGLFLDSGRTEAIAVSSIAFGLWHVLPGMKLAEANHLGWWVVPMAVLSTTTVGAVLCWVRLETGSVVTPVVLHAGINSLAAAAALAAHRP